MVMRQMRDNTKWIMIATGVAFVALMVFSWGMDITSARPSISTLGATTRDTDSRRAFGLSDMAVV